MKKQIDKIKVEDMKPSSRQYPFIRFEYNDKDKLYRQALIVNKMSQAFEQPLFENINFMIEAGEKIAIIGENGIGKTTLLKIIGNLMTPNKGDIKWSEKAKIGYFAQDHSEEFEKDILKPKDKKSKKKSSKKEKVEMNEGGTTMDTVMAITNALGAYGKETSKPNSDPLDKSKFVTPEPPRRR